MKKFALLSVLFVSFGSNGMEKDGIKEYDKFDKKKVSALSNLACFRIFECKYVASSDLSRSIKPSYSFSITEGRGTKIKTKRVPIIRTKSFLSKGSDHTNSDDNKQMYQLYTVLKNKLEKNGLGGEVFLVEFRDEYDKQVKVFSLGYVKYRKEFFCTFLKKKLIVKSIEDNWKNKRCTLSTEKRWKFISCEGRVLGNHELLSETFFEKICCPCLSLLGLCGLFGLKTLNEEIRLPKSCINNIEYNMDELLKDQFKDQYGIKLD